MSGIEAACREKGFTLLVCNTNNELDQELHYLDLLRSYQVEGIVVNMLVLPVFAAFATSLIVARAAFAMVASFAENLPTP